ncbi:hypothetical protein C5E44_04610 [Nocardia nova]|nr:hypothetical protein C5E44_04610 [Nocardia nova]
MRWSAAAPRGPSTHSVSLLKLPEESTKTRTGALPAVMMIGGEFNTPADWLRSGQIMPAIDAFTAAHAGGR